MPLTPFRELDELLTWHAEQVGAVLGDALVGSYLQGSFALGGGDAQSDADVVVVLTAPPTAEQEAGLRRLHEGIPDRPGIWHRNLEGSYADRTSLRSLDGLGTPWLFNDRGHRELEWSDHDNSVHVRWILRHHGVRIVGPPVTQVVDDVPAAAMREEAARELAGLLDGIRSWADLGHAWTQRYIVQTAARVLYTVRTGEATSKPAALAWAAEELDPRWRPLLAQVTADRSQPWAPVDPPRPGSMEQALAFAEHLRGLGAGAAPQD